MELIQEYEPPALIQLLLAGRHAIETGPGIQQFHFTVKEFSSTGTNLGKVRQVRHDLQPLHLFFRWSTTTIAPAIQIQQMIVDVLLTIVHPGPCHIARPQGAVVAIESCRCIQFWRRDKVSQDLRAIDAAPAKGITGHTVKLVPANLRGHEDGNIATAHNLWERGTIAKDIW